ncbi:Hypothetical predicted protein [Olea europaea subsp. europaea]|uniref:non-specific serine/threonine protein kinase n=1 Tax=Olea europaea subsp. europaea TaxID=158383 RepID=A0A8S0TLF6_OLEEU|nr:Hypothetical predicted protein [Olea europaea subsp. europaea]
MASLENLPFFFFLSTLFYTSINENLPKNSLISCSSSVNCGHGLSIGYPFWPQNQELEFCGYPGLGLSCNSHSHEPILSLHKNLYCVKSLDESQKTLTITYNEVNSMTICPVARHDFASNSSILFPKDNKMVHFFYNCTVYPPSVPDIKCLQRGAKHSYAFVNGSVPEFDWNQYCEDIVSVPVMKKGIEGFLGKGFGEVLKVGFVLTWKADSACQSCEDSGGFCGYKDRINHNQTFFCFCNERHHAHNCYDQTGEVSTAPSQPHYVIAGAVIFGGLITTSFILYLVQEKRIGVHKSGFSQIPRNYEK